MYNWIYTLGFYFLMVKEIFYFRRVMQAIYGLSELIQNQRVY